MKYNAIVNEQYEFPDLSNDSIDLLPISDREFHIIHDGRSYHATLLNADWNLRSIQIQVNGQNFEVRLEDRFDRLVKQLGLKANNLKKVKEIKAPMPGLVLKTEVEAGQHIETDDVLLILEAMKMENVIKALAPGQVKIIHVEQGQAVEKGQILIEME